MSYNSCRNRHCPKCQASAAKRWLEARQADLLPVDYFHVVFTIPSQINELAYQNKSVVYNILFKAVSQTLLLIGGDEKRLGGQLGATLVLHTWGSAMTHHPHIHCIIPGGGLSKGGLWKSCRQNYFLPEKVLSLVFRRRFLDLLYQAYLNGQLQFFGELQKIAGEKRFFYWIKRLKKKHWYLYIKKPFAGPQAVLAYLSRYTHRVAIANSRLIKLANNKVTFTYKDYRKTGKKQQQKMTLDVDEFMRRFLIHVLPSGFHRIRHIGLLANGVRKNNLDKIRKVLDPPAKDSPLVTTETQEPVLDEILPQETESKEATYLCRQCGCVMQVIDSFISQIQPRAPPGQYAHV